jgi:hypothetical protein
MLELVDRAGAAFDGARLGMRGCMFCRGGHPIEVNVTPHEASALRSLMCSARVQTYVEHLNVHFDS